MDDNIQSGKITVMDQRSYIKIETLRDITLMQIYESLREVCRDSTVDRSTISLNVSVKVVLLLKTTNALADQDRLQTTLQQSLLPTFWRKTGI
jgi:hypothetical protein